MDLPHEQAQRDYTEKIHRLARLLPGYGRLLDSESFFFDYVRFHALDIYPSGQVVGRPDLFWGTTYDYPLLHSWLVGGLDAQCPVTRCIFVEDLSPSFAITLGSAFDLDPQFFLDHINDQAPRANDRENQAHKKKWTDWHLEKPYMSLRWYRPARRIDVEKTARVRGLMEQAHVKETETKKKISNYFTAQFKVEIVRSLSNIIRSELDLSMAASSDSVPVGLAGIEERASIYQVQKETHSFIITLLDKVPELCELSWDQAQRPSAPYKPPEYATINVRDLYGGLVPRFPPNMTPQSLGQMDEQIFQDIYMNLAPTMSCLTTNMTLTNFPSTVPRELHLCFCLSKIIEFDTLGLLQILDNALKGIAESTASPNAEFEDLLSKRLLIVKLQTELPTLHQEITQQLQGLFRDVPEGVFHETTTQELTSSFNKTIDQIKEASNALTGTLQFIESHRAILEAESVTRVTELAFFFIPLSFAASLFSMQIQELSNPIPVWIFAAFAFSLSVFTYVLRLVVRSSWMQNSKSALQTAVREYSGTPYGASIPAAAFLRWAFVRLGPATGFALGLMCLVAPPLAVLWTRRLDTGLKVGVTFVLLVVLVLLSMIILLKSRSLRHVLRNGIDPDWMKRPPSGESPKEPWKLRIARRLAQA